MDCFILKTILLICIGFPLVLFSQKREAEKDQWAYTFSNAGQVDKDTLDMEIISPRRTDFQIQYKNGDTLLWQTAMNNAGTLFIPRRGVDSLILSSNIYPVIRFAFRDYPGEKLAIEIKPILYTDNDQSALRQDFKNDPTGCFGLREKHVIYNSEEALFDNQSLTGLTKDELTAFIGEPNEINGSAKRMKRHQIHNRQSFEYFITICEETQTGYSIVVLIEDNKVKGTVMRVYCG